jgi:sialic acid synthase SpsE
MIGFSDHSTNHVGAILPAVFAAILNERHVTYARKAAEPDRSTHLGKEQSGLMINCVRYAEAALGTEFKSPSDKKIKKRNFARKKSWLPKKSLRPENQAPGPGYETNPAVYTSRPNPPCSEEDRRQEP